MTRRLTGKQEAILEALRIEMASGKSLEEAAREILKSKQFNHMAVRRCVQKLAQESSNFNKWTLEQELSEDDIHFLNQYH